MRIFFTLLLGFCVRMSAQGPAVAPPPSTAPAQIPSSGLASFQAADFQGSVPSGQASATPIALSLQDAIDRGLKTNLGLLVRDTASRVAQAERIRTLSSLLPNVQGTISGTEQQIDLASFGFKFSGIPSVIGPFGYNDARASMSQTGFDLTALRNKRAADQNLKAAQLSVQDGRDLVVQAVAAAYLQIIADAARVEATKAQVVTAQALFDRARDQHRAGVSPAIDELRAQVELKTQQQALLSQQNQFDKDKLALARVIGLPTGQTFTLTDSVPYQPLEGLAPEEALHRALEIRADYQSALVQVHAAEISIQAIRAQRYPTLGLAANYGDIGSSFLDSHGTFAVTGSLKFNIWDSGRIRADQMQADAAVKQRRDELADLQGKIDFQIRTALLDLKTAADQVAVARDNLDLANQTLTQARDRFAAGVADNIEVVQAQDSVANANQSLISSVYSHNLAKVSLARAMGATETNLKQYLGGK
ncbi:MAG TPA: TolC family protein [Bryobacteraceae bacterium]|nr:TolC family protein [Bryobacteraceae bacterium]